MDRTEPLSIERSLERLDEILKQMEDQETGLEASLRLYEEGVRLIRTAEASIDTVEKRIRILQDTAESDEQTGGA